MNIDRLIQLGRLSLQFSRVNRITLHEDGERLESDTDHTFMLTLIACAIASEHPELGLDVGLVAQLCQVHDLVEVYAGDTPTLNITAEERVIKAMREAEALQQLLREFHHVPWLWGMLRRYEEQNCLESHFVRYVDKLMPKITHLLNDGAALAPQGVTTAKQLMARHIAQGFELKRKYPCFPPVDQLFDALTMRCDRDLTFKPRMKAVKVYPHEPREPIDGSDLQCKHCDRRARPGVLVPYGNPFSDTEHWGECSVRLRAVINGEENP